jgi:hypothetical protein
MLKKFLPVLFLPLLLAGCATHYTNLTPQQQPRSTNNLYLVEVAVASSQQTLRWGSIRPQIVVGDKFYDMHPTLLMTNRWEGLIPVVPGASAVNYRYKFDYTYNTWGKPKPGSSRSSEYTLRIQEP